MTKSEMAAGLNDANAWLPGKRVKLDFGDEGVVMLDGTRNPVTEDDGAADTTIKVAWDDWEAMGAGKLDGMTAFMQGKLKVEGDMSNAMQLQGVLGENPELTPGRRLASPRPVLRMRPMAISLHGRKTLFLLAETFAVFAALAVLTLAASRALPAAAAWPVIGFLAIAQGLWLDRMYTVAHEAVHLKLLPGRRPLNDLVGTVLMAPVLAPFTIFR